MSASSNGGRKDNTHTMSAAQQQNRDEIDIRPRERKNRSRSPLRTKPAEVFSRSPRANRHYEDGCSNGQVSARDGGAATSGRKPSPRSHISEDRFQQQASHMNAQQ